MQRLRFVLLAVAVVAIWSVGNSWAYCQSPPSAPLGPNDFARGPGFYLSPVKIALCWLTFLVWLRTTEWVNYDCLRFRTNYVLWNSVVVFCFLAAFILIWALPWGFVFPFILLLIAYFGPLGAYIYFRNAKLPVHEHVLTADHFRHLKAHYLSKIGIKAATEKKDARDVGPPVKFMAQGGATDRDNSANLLLARQSSGYAPTRKLVAEAIDYRAQSVRLDRTATAVALQYQLDGVWHDQPPREASEAAAVTAVLKQLAALNPEERRAKQEGAFGAEYQGATLSCKLSSQPIDGGERVTIRFVEKKATFKSLDDLGMRAKLQEPLKEALAADQGFVLFSGLPANGVSTTIDQAVRAMDRYMRDFVAVEDAGARERDIENVQVTTYKAAEDESPATVLPKLIRTYPNVFLVRELVNLETLKLLLDQVTEKRLVISSVRAKDSVEALLRVLMLKPSAKEFAAAVTMVVNQRLIRKLCPTCKHGYAPTAESLKQLGLPEGKVEMLYRPPSPDPKDPKKVCPDCRGIGYRGRTAIFEMLIMDTALRNALVTTPKLEILRAAARKSPNLRSLQEDGVLLVAKGVTSVAELQRVLKL